MALHPITEAARGILKPEEPSDLDGECPTDGPTAQDETVAVDREPKATEGTNP